MPYNVNINLKGVSNMNRIELIGRLATDVDLKLTSSGLAMARVTLAIDRPMSKEKKEQDRKENKQTADFPRLLLIGKVAENASRYLQKGSLIAAEGSVKTSNYENANGQKVYSTEILCDKIHFLEQSRKPNTPDEISGDLDAESFEIEEVAF